MPDTLVPGTTVAFVGLGNMGLPMAARLLAAGYEVRAYDQASGARQAYAARNDRDAVKSATAATLHAQALILMVPDSDAVRAVLTTDGVLESLRKGAVVIDMGSSDPVQTRELAADIERQGLSFVDAPVSGGVKGAETGELTIMVGGVPRAIERCRPLLQELGRVVVAGEVGAGHALKALNNLLSASHLLASAEALRVGTRFGLDPATMLDAINGSTGRSYSTEYKLPTFVLTESYASGFAMHLMNKDLKTALSLARATHTPTPLAEHTVAFWDEAATHLAAAADHTEIARWLDGLEEGD